MAMPATERSGGMLAGQQLSFDLFDVVPEVPAGLSSEQITTTQDAAQTLVATAKEAEPGVLRHPEANRESRLGEVVVAYHFARGQRRTIGLSVGPQGLSVRAPRWTPLGEVERFLQSKAVWVLEKLHQAQRQALQTPLPQSWHHGSPLNYLGRVLTLRLDPAHRQAGAGGVLVDDELVIGLSLDVAPARLREAVHAWLMREAERIFRERLDHFAPRLGVRYERLRLSSAGTRWGSASADGSIRLNWRLVHLSLEMIDYVVAHELSHLREMNHSADFWGVVGSVMPDYRERRLALRRVRLD